MADRANENTAIVMAAGKGKRMQVSENKVFLEIRKRPILFRTLSVLQASEQIDSIILVCQNREREKIKRMIDKNGPISKLVSLVDGGKERSDSVQNGLNAYLDLGLDGVIMVHDGARPFVTKRLINNLLREAEGDCITIPAMAVKETIRLIGENSVTQALPREKIYTVQTPQVFFSQTIERCFRQQKEKEQMTDEASWFEAAGMRVKVIEGEKWNIKITSPEDIKWASCLLSCYPELKLDIDK